MNATTKIRPGMKVRIVKPLSLLVPALGAEGWVKSVDGDVVEFRENGGTWYTVEARKLRIVKG